MCDAAVNLRRQEQLFHKAPARDTCKGALTVWHTLGPRYPGRNDKMSAAFFLDGIVVVRCLSCR